MLEIERKFLVKDKSFKTDVISENQIVQGFLNSDPERTVRVRIKNEKGFITVKGKSNIEGTIRFEWEKEILTTEAKTLLELCEKGIIEKTRYEIKQGNHIFEVDEFYGDNEGLIIAEIELNHETEIFKKPSWLGKEVTGEVHYYNSQLSINPYKNWRDEIK